MEEIKEERENSFISPSPISDTNYYGFSHELEPLKKFKTAEENGGGKREEENYKDFDEVLELVGSEGKFQKILLYGVLCPLVGIMPFFVMNLIFMLYIPDHWCFVPGRENDTTLEEWKNLTLPIEIGPDGLPRFSQCKMYVWSDGLDNENSTIEECKNGWNYTKDDYDSTLPSEFDWVCSKSHYATDSFTISAVGNAVGTVIFGVAADKYGRKPIFFATCFINMFFRAVSLFVPQYHLAYLAMMFLVGTAFPVMFSSPCMIAAESCSKEYRAWIYACVWMIWVIGNSAIPLLAWLCRGWFLFGILTSVPALFVFLFYKIIPESPRWLATLGRPKEAAQVMMRIAKLNGNDGKVTEKQLEEILSALYKKTKESEKESNIGFWTLFSKRRLAWNTIMLCIAWSVNMLIYYGLTLNTTNMSGNQFLNYFLLSIIELPSGWLGGILCERAGRRWTQVGFFMMCILAAFTAAVTVSNPDLSIVVIVAALAAKFAVTVTSLVVYLQGAEIFPTQLRSTGTGFASTFSSCVGIFGPYVIFLGKFHVAGPYIVLCIVSAIGMMSAACLPETFKQNLPETIEAANNFGKGNKFWSWAPKAVAQSRNSISGNQNLKNRKDSTASYQ